MPIFYIYASGTCNHTGYIGSDEYEKFECDDFAEAEQIAYEIAVQDFEGMGGTHGYGQTYDAFFEENPDANEEDYEDMMRQEAESWVDWHILTTDEYEALVLAENGE